MLIRPKIASCLECLERIKLKRLYNVILFPIESDAMRKTRVRWFGNLKKNLSF